MKNLSNNIFLYNVIYTRYINVHGCIQYYFSFKSLEYHFCALHRNEVLKQINVALLKGCVSFQHHLSSIVVAYCNLANTLRFIRVLNTCAIW